MKTEEIFKQIYQDLKEKIENKDNETFIKEYTIPSINYSSNENKEDLYFVSGIEMEIERILEQLQHKFFFSSYKDKYFFSNEQSVVQQKVLLEIEKEEDVQRAKLKEKFDEKIDTEYKEFIEDLEQCSPKIIIDRAYEKVCKEEMIYKLKDKDYTISELKTLLKTDEILQECYDEWLKSDGNFSEMLEYAVDNRIDLILEESTEQKRQRNKESR